MAATLLVLTTAHSARAEDVDELEWSDLVPSEVTRFHDPFTELSDAQLDGLGFLVRIRGLLAEGRLDPDGPDAQEAVEIEQELAAAGIDVDALLAQRDAVRQKRRTRAMSTADRLAGRTVRIPGYVLPLAREKKLVTEFLLVPYVGACIHVPPPPANQIVLVTSKEGIPDRGQFAAIWVTGELVPGLIRRELYLVDGAASVPIAYSMEATGIDRYSSADSNALANVDVPSLAPDHSWWQRMQFEMNILFTSTMTDLGDRRTLGALLFGLLVSFLYGLLHTLGPGHGKTVVVSYFIGEGGSLRRGVGMGVRIAIFHVLAAVVIVVLADFVLRQTTGHSPAAFKSIRLVSYASIVLIGTFMLVGAIRSMREGTSASCSCDSHSKRTGGVLALAVGCVPCTGALLVMLYGLANDLVWLSVLMVVAISIGMAVAMSAIGIAAILGRRVLERRGAHDERRRARLAGRLRVASAVVVMLVGCTLFAWTAGDEGVRNIPDTVSAAPR
ncbi:MAG: DUF3299 domain-containing protein [Planctomycetota bacterium]|nr:DUF3299 domain-containing protein [Planctomycetota bacterium]